MSKRGFRDYFSVLGIERRAGVNEIKSAFRKLARKYHPDVNPGDREAEERFKEVSEAYEVLSDPEKRKRYEQYGKYWNNQSSGYGSRGVGFDADFGGYGNFDEFINDLLGRFGGVRGSAGYPGGQPYAGNYSSRVPINLDAEISLKITFAEAYRGTERTLSINDEKVQVRIPKGLKSGARLRIKGKGNLQPGVGRRGDLYINLEVKDHPIWRLNGNTLFADLPLALDEIILGATVKTMTPDGLASITIPPRTTPGQHLRLKGKGWPIDNEQGDLMLIVKMQLPEQWDPTELELLEQLKSCRNIDPRKDWFKLAHL